MIKGLREAIARELPEHSGNMYIFDDSQDAHEELARAAAALGVPDLEQRILAYRAQFPPDGDEHPRYIGEAMVINLENDRRIALAFGWGYSVNLDSRPPDLHFVEEDMVYLTKVVVHETAHMAQYLYHPNPLGPDAPDHATRRHSESFAELFAKDVGIRNGSLPISRAMETAATYDAERLFRENDMYDPSEELKTLLGRHYAGQGDELYRANFTEFHGLRDSLERTLEIAMQHAGNDLHTHGAYSAFNNVRGFTIRSLREQGKSDEEIADYILSRPDIYHDAPQAAAGRAHIAVTTPMLENFNRQDTPMAEQRLPPYNFVAEPPLDLVRRAAVAHLSHSRSGDPIERYAAVTLGEEWLFQQQIGRMPSIGITFEEGQLALDNRSCTVWAERILAGSGVEEITQGLRECSAAREPLPGDTPPPLPTPILPEGNGLASPSR